MKVERENNMDHSSIESRSKAGVAAHSIVHKSNEDNPIDMNRTSQVGVPTKLSDNGGQGDDEENRKRAMLAEMGSTGEVAVEKSLGLNTQDEALEFAATT